MNAAKVLVCFALEDEARAFRKLIRGRTDVSVLVTGIGMANTERSLRGCLQKNSPQRVFTCGFAGGLDPALKTGDVVVHTKDEPLNRILADAGAKPGRFHCSSRIATTVAEKADLRRTTGADAVEMESAAVMKLCGERGIPCATVRVISDTAHEAMPLDFNQLANPDLSLNYGKLAWAIVKAPGKIPALRRLQQSTAFAARQLAELLVKVV